MNTRPWLTLIIAGMALALGLSPTASAALELSREALSRGELWRLFTGHLVHFNTEHLLWDVAVWVLLGTVLEKDGRRRLAATLVASALACSAAVLLCKPTIGIYRGLSGIDSALFGLFAGDLILGYRNRGRTLARVLAGIAFLGFAAKTAWEASAQTTVFASSGGDFVPVPAAHLAGIVTGIAATLLAHRKPVPAPAPGTPAVSEEQSDRGAHFPR